jgi:hypothetical protein
MAAAATMGVLMKVSTDPKLGKIPPAPFRKGGAKKVSPFSKGGWGDFSSLWLILSFFIVLRQSMGVPIKELIN